MDSRFLRFLVVERVVDLTTNVNSLMTHSEASGRGDVWSSRNKACNFSYSHSSKVCHTVAFSEGRLFSRKNMRSSSDRVEMREEKVVREWAWRKKLRKFP